MVTKEELLRWQTDKEFQLEMVKNNVNSIQYIFEPSIELQLIAVKQNGLAIQYINNPNIEVQTEAVKKHGSAIAFIHNPSIELQLLAVKQNPLAIQFLHNPDIEILNELISSKNINKLSKLIRYVDIEKYPEIYEKYLLLNM